MKFWVEWIIQIFVKLTKSTGRQWWTPSSGKPVHRLKHWFEILFNNINNCQGVLSLKSENLFEKK